MLLTVISVVVILALGVFVWRRGSDRSVERVPAARRLRLFALIPLLLQAAVFLLFGLGEMAGGDLAGAGHLLELAVIVLLGVLVWLRPLEGGIALFAAGVLFAVQFLVAARVATAMTPDEPTVMSPALLILALPMLLAGVLFVLAGWLGRRANRAE